MGGFGKHFPEGVAAPPIQPASAPPCPMGSPSEYSQYCPMGQSAESAQASPGTSHFWNEQTEPDTQHTAPHACVTAQQTPPAQTPPSQASPLTQLPASKKLPPSPMLPALPPAPAAPPAPPEPLDPEDVPDEPEPPHASPTSMQKSAEDETKKNPSFRMDSSLPEASVHGKRKTNPHAPKRPSARRRTPPRKTFFIEHLRLTPFPLPN